MKILVTLKRVIDPEDNLIIAKNKKYIETQNVNMIINPFDEIAVEEALRLKEYHNAEVVIISVGTKEAKQQIRAAFAMGADRGILLVTKKEIHDGYTITCLLEQIVRNEQPNLILMGKQAIDDDSHQIAEMLAEKLDYGQATQASSISIINNHVQVVREIDGGLEKIEVELPCIVSADLRLNEPRYASLPGIMKAKTKTLKEIRIDDLNLNIPQMTEIIKLEKPKTRKSGEIVPDIETLLKKLKHEAKII